MRIIPHKICRENRNSYYIYNKFFSENRAVYGIMCKNTVVTQAIDDNMAHAHCMLDIRGYKHTLRICNIYCFYTATKIKRTRCNVTLHLHCLCYLLYPATITQNTLMETAGNTYCSSPKTLVTARHISGQMSHRHKLRY